MKRRGRRRKPDALKIVIALLIAAFGFATVTLIEARKAQIAHEEWIKQDDAWWEHYEAERAAHKARMANLGW